MRKLGVRKGVFVPKEVSETFVALGLTESESSLWLALHKLTGASLSDLSREVGLSVSTTQSILKRLVLEGFVLTDTRTQGLFYRPVPVEVVSARLRSLEQSVLAMSPFLDRLSKGVSGLSRVTFFEGRQVLQIFEEMLESKSKLIKEIVSPLPLQNVLGERFHFSRRRVKSGVKLQSLRVRQMEIKQYNRQKNITELREARFLPSGVNFEMSMFIWDDCTAFVSSQGEGFGFISRSRELRVMMESVFGVLWGISANIV